MRASYQDSNIFNTEKHQTVVQKTAAASQKELRQRVTDTFKTGAYKVTKPDDVKGRDQNTFNSTVFGAPI